MSGADETDDGLFPISERRIEQAFYLVLFAWVALLLVDTRALSFSAGLVPRLVGVPILVLIVLVLVPVDWTSVVDRYLPESDADEPEDVDGLTDRMSTETGNPLGVEQRVAAELIGWTVALVVLIHAFGFYYTLPPYIFALTWYLKRDLRSAIVVTVVFIAVVTLLFLVLFEQRLFRGMIDLPHPFL